MYPDNAQVFRFYTSQMYPDNVQVFRFCVFCWYLSNEGGRKNDQVLNCEDCYQWMTSYVTKLRLFVVSIRKEFKRQSCCIYILVTNVK